MRSLENNRWRHTSVERLLPPTHAEAPFVAGLEAREAVARRRPTEVVPPRRAVREKVCRHDGADSVAAFVCGARLAEAVAEKPGARRETAAGELCAEDIFGA